MPVRAETPPDLDEVSGVIIFSEEGGVLFHVLEADDPNNASGETLYGITLLDNEGQMVRPLGILEDEDAFHTMIRVVTTSKRRPEGPPKRVGG